MPEHATNMTSSVVRKHAHGVTVVPTAEGPSLRSDPRWTRDRARRAQRFLDRLLARLHPESPGL